MTQTVAVTVGVRAGPAAALHEEPNAEGELSERYRTMLLQQSMKIEELEMALQEVRQEQMQQAAQIRSLVQLREAQQEATGLGGALAPQTWPELPGAPGTPAETQRRKPMASRSPDDGERRAVPHQQAELEVSNVAAELSPDGDAVDPHSVHVDANPAAHPAHAATGTAQYLRCN